MPSAMNLAGCFGFRSKKKRDKNRAPRTPDNIRKNGGSQDTASNYVTDNSHGDSDFKPTPSPGSPNTSCEIPRLPTNDDEGDTTPSSKTTAQNEVHSSEIKGAVNYDRRILKSLEHMENGAVDMNSVNINLTNRDKAIKQETSNVTMGLTMPGEDNSSSDEADRAAELRNDATPTQKDGAWFLLVVSRVESQLKECCDTTLTYLKSQDKISEEVGGQLRAATGKAQLLVNKKFKQFKGQCEKNLNQEPDVQFSTTSMDLEGFWDMVQIQVDEVLQNFSDIEKLRKNNWKLIESAEEKPGMTTPTTLNGSTNHNADLVEGAIQLSDEHSKKHTTPRRQTPKKTPNKSSGANTPSKLAAHRDEARKRLMAAKQAMKERRNSESEDMIFVTVS